MTTTTTPAKNETAAAGPFQFRIRDLLLIMLLVGLLAAGIVQQNVLLFFVFLGVGVYCMFAVWGRVTLVKVLLVGFGCCALIALLLPAVGSRPVGPRMMCQNNLRQIAIALHNYHDVYGSFPPAYIADKNGRPLHSWRVLILPFMEQENLYKLYRFDEPWDGPNNRKLAGTIMRLYSCPSEHNEKSLETSYVAIVGPHTAWPGERSLALNNFPDGVANVLLVVEVHDSGIHWMEPRDLHVLQMAPTINPKVGQGISSAHKHAAQAAFADASIRSLQDTLPADVVQSWINLDDGTLPEPPGP